MIDRVELNDTATYYCHTQNPHGEKWINFTVEIINGKNASINVYLTCFGFIFLHDIADLLQEF